jgi:SOS-response transcriptional repressor LexA
MKMIDPLEYKTVPVEGQVAAGASVEFLPTVRTREVRLPNWADDSDRFVLTEVCGDSLCDAGIFSGDYALIHLNPNEIKDGDLIAAFTPDGMLIKFYFNNDDGRIRLEGANPSRPARYYDPEDISVQGKVIRTERDR